MYQVRCDDYVIYDLRDNDLKIISPKLTTELGKTGTFDFTIPPQNTNYDKIKKLKSIITIYQDKEEIWRGRVLNDKLDFYNRKQVECEGELAFLLDTIQRPFEFQGTPKELFQKFINSHNSEVEEQKRFKIRNVTITDTNDYINRENSSYATTWDSINDKLIETNGGYLETGPLENRERYIDYISEYTQINSQTIEFGKNLLDITQYAKGEDIKIHKGAAQLAIASNIDIIPVKIDCDYDFLQKNKSMLDAGEHIVNYTLEIQPVIRVKDFENLNLTDIKLRNHISERIKISIN